MEYLELSIITDTAGVDSALEVLDDLNITGAWIEDQKDLADFIEDHKNSWDLVDDGLFNMPAESRVRVYLEMDDKALSIVEEIRQRLSGVKVQITQVDDQNWLYKWKEFYRPFVVGKRLVICPEWEEYQSIGDQLVLRLNPGHVFGTGQHQSTQFCLTALEEYLRPNDRVIDIGCGSGILAIGALKLGASFCHLTEIEPGCNDTIVENMLLNGFGPDNFELNIVDILTDTEFRKGLGLFDIVCANIVADVIIPLSGIMDQILKPGGKFIASGIIKDRANEVAEAISGASLRIIKQEIKDEWAVIVAQRD